MAAEHDWDLVDIETGSNLPVLEGGIGLVNESPASDKEVKEAIAVQYPDLISKADIARLDNWVSTSRGQARPGGIFSQNKFVAPDRIFDEFRVAANAARDDDVVANAVETTEQLAFKRVKIQPDGADPEQQSIWDQIADGIGLEQRMREIWRELFIISQCYVATLWHREDYKVKALTDEGKRSKKVYKQLLVPKGITILDPCKVLPVGNFMFGQEDLVYIADYPEARAFHKTLADENSSDLIVSQLISGRYTPSLDEERQIYRQTGETGLRERMFLLNKDNVWRITSTRPDYQKFADVRMRSVFELLDLKHNLREMDRTDILGNLNAIILVKKGAKDEPATQAEIAGAAAQVHQSARIPIIVSDHRLEIEIVQRKTDFTLRPERYNNLDSRITSRLFQILSTGNYSSGTPTDNSPGLFRVIAATMEARRDNIRDAIMKHIFDQIWERNDKLIGEPEMRFYPRRISLDFDEKFAQYIFDLFALDQISHDTVLAEVDIDLVDEVDKKRREMELFGDVFKPPVQAGAPGQESDSNTTGDQKADGRIGGGNSNGGGRNQESFQTTPPTSGTRKVATAELEEDDDILLELED